jgi:hypothetical protein
VGENAAQHLLEDEFTGIMERTSIAGDPGAAEGRGRDPPRGRRYRPPVSRADLLREAMTRIRRISVVVHFPALDDRQLRNLLDEVYADTLGCARTPTCGLTQPRAGTS